ncbi:hypothetical protein [Novosphingobium sp. AP12]|uniref:hypothetical protein n=1 Tax=Novosphingobium sp. AP12 TaxID=1144305 RepID=UPI0002721FAD|nr:hypothetical protein [Novosphingobium sp. AP12]EJL20726.1 hypothetical protein PMI02_05463 [Novosphingobium sp. AP12]
MATTAGAQVVRLSFWAKMTIGMSLFIVFGFAQFALRGFVPYTQVPLIFHLHGMTMLAWLGLLCTQSVLAGRGVGLEIHRKLGWASALMLPLIMVLASVTCVTALQAGFFPPFFTPAYFLALVHVGVVIFAVLLATAIAWRAQADWHKRLIIGSTVLLMEPALGRVLPMPFIMPWGEWVAMVIQLGVVALVVRHDRRSLGRVHPATMAVMLAVVLGHVVIELLAISPWWIAFAGRVAAA